MRVSALSGSLLLERRFSKDEVIARVRETVQQEANEPLTQLKLIQEKGDKELPEGARLDELPLNSKGFLDLTALRTPAHCALVGFGDGTLRLWDLERGALARNLLPAGPAVSGLEVDWEGRRALSGDMNHNVRHWDLEEGRCLHCLTGHLGIINGVLVDWERSQAATYDRAGLFIFWDLACGRASHTILAHEGMVLDAEVDWGDTARSVTVGSDCRITAWAADRQVCSIRLQGEDGDLDDLVDGGLEVHWKTSRLVACWDRAAWVWDLATGRTLHTLRAPAGSVKGFNVDWDSSRCVAWVSGGQCLLWCLRTGQLLEKLIGPTSAICGLACCWEEERLLSFGSGPLCLWTLAPRAVLSAQLRGHTNVVAGVEVSWEADRALSWADDATLRLWDLKEHTCLFCFIGHGGPVWSAQVDWERGLAMSYSFAQRNLLLCNLKTGDSSKFPFAGSSAWSGGAEVDFSRQRAVAWTVTDGMLAVADLATGAVCHLQGSSAVTCVRLEGAASSL